jgi:hypothetical protein
VDGGRTANSSMRSVAQLAHDELSNGAEASFSSTGNRWEESVTAYDVARVIGTTHTVELRQCAGSCERTVHLNPK